MQRESPTYANDRIISEVAEELGLSKALVTEIVSVQFEYVAFVMRMNTLYGVILPYLGKIKVKVDRVYGLHWRRANSQLLASTFKPKKQ